MSSKGPSLRARHGSQSRREISHHFWGNENSSDIPGFRINDSRDKLSTAPGQFVRALLNQ